MLHKFILNINPSTGEVIEKIKCSSFNEIASSLKLARKAFKNWSETSLKAKVNCFLKIKKDLLKEKKNLAELVTLEMGKPMKDSIKEIEDAIRKMEFLISIVKDAFEPVTKKHQNLISVIHYNPIGIAAIITPFNYPVATPQTLLSNSILAGNCVIFKPSEITPLTGNLLYSIYNNNLPKGVINIIQGSDEVFDYLINSEIDLIGFTGTLKFGKRILNASARKLIRVILELGGKDPMVVCKDADITKAAEFAVNNSFSNSGQDCISVERIYVVTEIYRKFLDVILKKAKEIKCGDPRGNVHIGPLATESIRNVVYNQIEEAKRKGAKILLGGTKPDMKGYYIMPTVISEVGDKMEIMTIETFGPVICVQEVSDIEEAITKSNNTQYGLGATVWTRNLKKGIEISGKIQAGMVGINGSVRGVPGTPWIGIKQSGYNYTGSVEGLRNFTNIKKISYEK